METSSPSSAGRSGSASPPPKCAICLGTCNNKCCSDSCRHHFCFTCLLEWSKVKPECPLCKQPFKSIIHNIKSNSEYDEHFITRNDENRSRLEDYFLPQPPSRHYQFRTTFTVDPGGELAIQQMLESHPLTNNSVYGAPGNYVIPHHRIRRGRHTRASPAVAFRNSIYDNNLWVYAAPDVTGRCRETTPLYYRENPTARHRLVPWLNRELSALMNGNTLSVMYLVDLIMDHLQRWNIRSRDFKNLLTPFLREKTSHFIHEFYNFMRSPFDMVGYDRHIVYSDIPHSPTYSISDVDADDSDVAIVNVSLPVVIHNDPFRQPTLEVIEINSDSSRDSDVIIREPTPPEVVDLLDSDSNENNANSNNQETEERPRKPVLPIKIRLKCKRQSREKKRKHHRRSSSSSNSSSGSDSRPASRTPPKRKKHKYKRSKHAKSHKKSHKNDTSESRTSSTSTSTNSSSSSTSCSEDRSSKKRKVTFDSDDNLPLSKMFKKELERKEKSCTETQTTCTVTSVSKKPAIYTASSFHPSCSNWRAEEKPSSSSVHHQCDCCIASTSKYEPYLLNSSYYMNHDPFLNQQFSNSAQTILPRRSYTPPYRYDFANVLEQIQPLRVNASTSPINLPGPSGSSRRLQSVIVKKETSRRKVDTDDE